MNCLSAACVCFACADLLRFSRVVIADRRKPASHAVLAAATKAVAPWVEELVEYAYLAKERKKEKSRVESVSLFVFSKSFSAEFL